MFTDIVFYGRTWGEYEDMFGLKTQSLAQSSVLDCPGGPSSFQVHARREHGVDVVSVDPMYAKSTAELEALAEKDLNDTLEKMRSKGVAPAEFISQMEAKRRECMKGFLDHFQSDSGRYVAASLPTLPFEDSSFDIVLSGNLSFCYSSSSEDGLMEEGGLDLEWHRAAVAELLRVARREVRIYPAFSMTTMMNSFPTVAHHTYADILMKELHEGGKYQCEYYDTVADGVATIGLKITMKSD